jgi:hypothetical protein
VAFHIVIIIIYWFSILYWLFVLIMEFSARQFISITIKILEFNIALIATDSVVKALSNRAGVELVRLVCAVHFFTRPLVLCIRISGNLNPHIVVIKIIETVVNSLCIAEITLTIHTKW